MGQLLFRVLEQTQTLWINSQVGVPSHTSVDPVLVPLFIGSWDYEVLHLHLLKFASTEDEVTWSDFIAERFSDLTNSKWWLLTRCGRDVFKINEDTLRSFWAKVCKT